MATLQLRLLKLGARVHGVQGTDHDCVALVMSGGTGIEALFNVVRVCTPEAAGLVSAIAPLRRARCKTVVVGPEAARRGAPEHDAETDSDTAKTS